MNYGTVRTRILENAGTEKIFLAEPETGETLTYRQIGSEAERLKETLELLGFKKGNRVAIALQNSITAAVCILGVMYAGGVVVPVNLGWKSREFTWILENSGSSFLISTDTVLAEAGVSITSDRETAFRGNRILHLKDEEASDGSPLQETDLALMLYTSGTTGAPKGVMLTHRNLLAEASYIQKGHSLTEEDRALLVLPLFHINGLVIGFLTPFLSGGMLVIPRKFSAGKFWGWIEKYRITWVSAVPTILSMLLSRTPADYHGAAGMRFMRSASAPLPVAVLKEFEERFRIPVIESFGISEGASQITTNPIEGERKSGSAGKAVGNVVEIVDEDGRLLPPGICGEVRIRGDNIFSGYYQNEEETGKSLRDGWFYSGDLGRLDEDGYLFLEGRKKELINRAGEKFSPREIDEVLYQIPGIELAAAVGVPDPLYNEEVVAYVRLQDGAVLTEREIIEGCRGKIADFKLPKKIFFIDDFPKGPSGKIQRLKLAERYVKQKQE